ncbi:rhodanese-like domain-containing protein [uncultured Dechloromonas sp.]|uniref:rhodanese-like domain-containing protein n=1 Tax=uncultured Dechloromonas sp. TaxID=171719 RepID=UPI0025D030D2|nr:rhodanese-like domain-containing protein [uncultured Dechloromonas sp.]
MTTNLTRNLLAAAAIALSAGAWAADWAPGTASWEQLPELKRSKLGLYLTPQQAYDMKKANPKGVALFDIRTRAEAMYVGWPGDADALVPYLEHPEIMTEWDDRRFMYKLEPNQDFIPELERRLTEMGLGKDATIILICRSGDRSAKAADRLQMAGYGKVYSIAEGFEGDIVKDGARSGQRAVNGWKNANLPWTYKLDKNRMYFTK